MIHRKVIQTPPALPFGGVGATGGLEGHVDRSRSVRWTSTSSAGCAARCTSTEKAVDVDSSREIETDHQIFRTANLKQNLKLFFGSSLEGVCVERFLCAIRNLESGNARPAAQVARLSCDCFVLTGSVSTAHIANNVSRREKKTTTFLLLFFLFSSPFSLYQPSPLHLLHSVCAPSFQRACRIITK